MLTLDGNCIFTNTAMTDDGDVWWEGMTDEPPAHLHRLEGPGLDAGVGHAGRPPQRPLHRPGRPGPGHRPRVGGPARACRSPPSSSAAGGRRWCRWSSSRATGTTACSWARSWRRRPPRRRPVPSGNLRRDPFAMLPFCGYNMADYFAHWLDIGDSAPDPEQAPQDLLRQLVPQGRRRASGCGRATARTPGCSSGSSSAWCGKADAIETPIGSSRRPGPSTSTAST